MEQLAANSPRGLARTGGETPQQEEEEGQLILVLGRTDGATTDHAGLEPGQLVLYRTATMAIPMLLELEAGLGPGETPAATQNHVVW